jgi:hypothetical protein
MIADGDRRLAGLPVADDELALPAADRDHASIALIPVGIFTGRVR